MIFVVDVPEGATLEGLDDFLSKRPGFERLNEGYGVELLHDHEADSGSFDEKRSYLCAHGETVDDEIQLSIGWWKETGILLLKTLGPISQEQIMVVEEGIQELFLKQVT